MNFHKFVILIAYVGFTSGFTVLPFIQIDFTHYFRLAQCEAKCSQKYGKLNRRRLLDGTFMEILLSDDDNGKSCEMGCRRRQTTQRFSRKARNAFEEGIEYWFQTGYRTNVSDTVVLNGVRLGCMNIATVGEGEFVDTVEGNIFVDLNEQRQKAIKLIVQWKQRIRLEGVVEESGWITASIESEPTIPVNGMLPDIHYRFMVTAVGPDGRLGGPIISEWVQAISLDKPLNSPMGPLRAKSKFDSENGVSALISWSPLLEQRLTITDIPEERLSSVDSCFYRISVSNSSHIVNSRFAMDTGSGFLFAHLQFDNKYVVSLSALASSLEAAKFSEAITISFNTLTCNEVFGPGSLNCAPEPVRELSARVLHNGTAEIYWTPSSDHSSILAYQLSYFAITNSELCSSNIGSVYLNATSESAYLNLPNDYPCSYLVRLTNYDLMGREASNDIELKLSAIIPSEVDDRIIILIASLVFSMILLCICLKISLCIFRNGDGFGSKRPLVSVV